MTLNLGSDYPSNWFDNVEASGTERVWSWGAVLPDADEGWSLPWYIDELRIACIFRDVHPNYIPSTMHCTHAWSHDVSWLIVQIGGSKGSPQKKIHHFERHMGRNVRIIRTETQHVPWIRIGKEGFRMPGWGDRSWQTKYTHRRLRLPKKSHNLGIGLGFHGFTAPESTYYAPCLGF